MSRGVDAAFGLSLSAAPRSRGPCGLDLVEAALLRQRAVAPAVLVSDGRHKGADHDGVAPELDPALENGVPQLAQAARPSEPLGLTPVL